MIFKMLSNENTERSSLLRKQRRQQWPLETYFAQSGGGAVEKVGEGSATIESSGWKLNGRLPLSTRN